MKVSYRILAGLLACLVSAGSAYADHSAAHYLGLGGAVKYAVMHPGYNDRSFEPFAFGPLRRHHYRSTVCNCTVGLGNAVALARPEPPLVLHGIRAVLRERTHYDFDRSRLKQPGRELLDALIARLAALDPDYGMGRYGYVLGIDLIGHTDSIGSDSYNIRLGERRAQSVADYLLDKGVYAGAFNIFTRGEQQPVTSNATAAGRAQNRRTEIIVFLVTVPEWQQIDVPGWETVDVVY